jgi:hypothetical protein
MTHLRITFAIAVVTVTAVIPLAHGDGDNGRAFKAKNESGEARTINVAGFPVVAPDNPFFLDLGTNGRRCVTCHQPADNMSVSASSIAERFEKTSGEDPIFRLVDGANSPLADVSTREERRQAYSMLLTKGVIRVGLPVPENAEFILGAAADPYGYAGNNANGNELSLFRRPLPTTNLAFLSTVMWDGRETLQKGSAEAIDFNLAHQSNSATEGHAQAPTPLDEATRKLIVAYQRGLFTAQVSDAGAGDLRKDGATGGPEELANRLFVFGGNDPLGCDARAALHRIESTLQPHRVHRLRCLGASRGQRAEPDAPRHRAGAGAIQHAARPDQGCRRDQRRFQRAGRHGDVHDVP